MKNNKIKHELDRLTQDALTKQEILLETLIQLLIEKTIIDEYEFKSLFEDNLAKTNEKLKKLQEDMKKLLKEMHEKALDDKVKDPNDNSGYGNC